MMSHQEILVRLDAYLDGDLSTQEMREVESHLEGCEDCTAVLRRLGSLLDAASSLREREQSPRQDLWPSIRARIEPQANDAMEASRATGDEATGSSGSALAGRQASPVTGSPGPRRAGLERFRSIRRLTRGLLATRRPLAWAAVAAVVLIAAYAALHRPDQPVSPTREGTELARLEGETGRARADVESRVDEEPELLAAESDFRRNLDLLDQAIRDSRRALEADPENRAVQRSLVVFYQRQLDLLKWASRLFGEA